QLWVAEALLSRGEVRKAKETIDGVRADLQGSPDMIAWGYLARIDAKIAIANNRLALAIQLLEQSSSLFGIRENKHQRAVNRVVLAQIFEKQGSLEPAIAELEQAISVLGEIGAAIDESKAREFLERLKTKQAGDITTREQANLSAAVDLASAVDGFIAQ